MDLNKLAQGFVEVDSEFAREIGFTSDKFAINSELGSRLFIAGNCIYIQAIEVVPQKRRKGHFNSLLDQLWDRGFTIKVPNPFPTMYRILKKKGFKESSEQSITASDSDIDVVLIGEPPNHI